jgi:hypothetical protein
MADSVATARRVGRVIRDHDYAAIQSCRTSHVDPRASFFIPAGSDENQAREIFHFGVHSPGYGFVLEGRTQSDLGETIQGQIETPQTTVDR